jgi:hypothetical protein
MQHKETIIPFLQNFDPHIFYILQRFYLPRIPAFAGMTFSATPLVKAVIPARSLPSTTIGGWNPGEEREKEKIQRVRLVCWVNIKWEWDKSRHVISTRITLRTMRLWRRAGTCVCPADLSPQKKSAPS